MPGRHGEAGAVASSVPRGSGAARRDLLGLALAPDEGDDTDGLDHLEDAVTDLADRRFLFEEVVEDALTVERDAEEQTLAAHEVIAMVECVIAAWRRLVVATLEADRGVDEPRPH